MSEIDGRIASTENINGDASAEGVLRGTTNSTNVSGIISNGYILTPEDKREIAAEVSGDIGDLMQLMPEDAAIAGRYLRIKSVNADGTFVCEWAEVQSGGGTITDVKVNTTSVVSNGVATVPLGSSSTYGAIKTGNGLSASSGTVKTNPATTTQITGRTVGQSLSTDNVYTHNPIVPATLDFAVKSALSDAKASFSEEEQKAIWGKLGIDTAIIGEVITLRGINQPFTYLNEREGLRLVCLNRMTNDGSTPVTGVNFRLDHYGRYTVLFPSTVATGVEMQFFSVWARTKES